MAEQGKTKRELLAQAVREALRAKNWRQIELAAAAGISQSTISNIVHALADTSAGTLRRLAETLDWDESTLTRLFYGEIDEERELLIEQISYALRPLSAEELLQVKRALDEILPLLRLGEGKPGEGEAGESEAGAV